MMKASRIAELAVVRGVFFVVESWSVPGRRGWPGAALLSSRLAWCARGDGSSGIPWHARHICLAKNDITNYNKASDL